jgi:hypothetical protein
MHFAGLSSIMTYFVFKGLTTYSGILGRREREGERESEREREKQTAACG